MNDARILISPQAARGSWTALSAALLLHAGAALALTTLHFAVPEPEPELVIAVDLVSLPPPPQPEAPALTPPSPQPAAVPTPVTTPKPVTSPVSRPAAAATAPAPAPAALSATAPIDAPAPVGAPSPAVTEAPRTAGEPMTPPSAHAAYLNNPRPHYPALARKRGWEGTVVLAVAVDAEGRAEGVTVRVSSGHDVLDRCAEAAVRQWRFVPARRGAQAVAASVEVPIRFNLTEESLG